MLKLKSAPTLSYDHKVWKLVPQSSAELNKKWVGVGLHCVGLPVAKVFISYDHFTVHPLPGRVGRLAINIHAHKLCQIRLKNLRPRLSIVAVNSVNTGLLGKCKHLTDQSLPRLGFPVVEHGCVLILDCVTIGAVADIFTALLI